MSWIVIYFFKVNALLTLGLLCQSFVDGLSRRASFRVSAIYRLQLSEMKIAIENWPEIK